MAAGTIYGFCPWFSMAPIIQQILPLRYSVGYTTLVMVKPVIYTTPTCQFCKMAKAFFNEQGIAYEEKDVASDMGARQEMIDKSGQLGVPVITVGENVVIGFDKPTLEHLLGGHK